MEKPRPKYYFALSQSPGNDSALWRFTSKADRQAWVDKYPAYRTALGSRDAIVRKACRLKVSFPVEID